MERTKIIFHELRWALTVGLLTEIFLYFLTVIIAGNQVGKYEWLRVIQLPGHQIAWIISRSQWTRALGSAEIAVLGMIIISIQASLISVCLLGLKHVYAGIKLEE